MTKLISGVLGFVLASILAVVAAVLTTTPARVAPSFTTIEENKEDASALNRKSISGQKDDNEPINVDTSTASHQLADDPKVLEGVESSLDDSESTKCSSSVRYVRNSEETAAIRDVRNCRIRKKLVMKNTTCICVCSSGNSGDCTSTQSMLDNNIGMNTNGSGQQNNGPVSVVTYQGDYVATQIIHVNVFPTNRQLTFIFLVLFYFGRHHRATR